MHSIIIIFLTKSSSRNGIRRKHGSNWGYYYFLFEKTTVNVLFNLTRLLSHRQAGTPMTDIQSTLRSAPDLCKNVPLAVLFGSNGNSYTISTLSDMCICTPFLRHIEKLVGQKKLKKKKN